MTFSYAKAGEDVQFPILALTSLLYLSLFLIYIKI